MPKTTEKIKTQEKLNSQEKIKKEIEQVLKAPEKVESFYEFKQQIENLNKIYDLTKKTNNPNLKKELKEKTNKIEKNTLNYAKQVTEKAKTDPKYTQLANGILPFLEDIAKIDKTKEREISNIKKEIKNLLDYTLITNNFIEKVSVGNKTISIPIAITERFNIKTDNRKIFFQGKNNLPISFDIDVVSDSDNTDNIIPNINNSHDYTPWIENVKIDADKASYIERNNAILFSYTKNGKNYVGVIGFNFDRWNGEIKNFRTAVKETNKFLSKKDLENYFDEIYDSGIFDRTGYTIENSTILSDINGMDVGMDEKSYKSLAKKYKNKEALDTAIKLIEAEIATNPNYLKYFDIGLADKEGANTGNITGAIITELGLSQAGLLDSNLGTSLKKYYELVDKSVISPYEARKIINSIKKYPNFSKLSHENKIKFLLDFNNSGKLGDFKETYFGEKQIYDLLSQLPIEKQQEKIKELEKLGGKTTKEETVLDKIFLKRGIDIFVNMYGPSALEEYLTTNKKISEIVKQAYNLEKQKEENILKMIFGDKAEQFKEKIKQKTEELYNKIPENIKRNHPELKERLENALTFAGISAFYIANPYGKPTGGLSARYHINNESISKVVDHLDIGVVNHKGAWLLGVGFGKDFTLKEFNNKKGNLHSGYELVNFTIPLVTLGVKYDFSKTKLENWTDKTSGVVADIGWLFPGLIGKLGYNFERKQKIDERIEKYNNFINKLTAQIKKCKNTDCKVLNPENYKDKVEKYTINVIKEFLNKINFFKSNDEQYKNFVLQKMTESLSKNYETLNYLSNQGTKISEAGIIWALILPIPYFSTESIKTHFEANAKSGSNDIIKIKSGEKGEHLNISNVNQLQKYMDNHLGKEIAEVKNNHLEIDLNKLPKGYILAFDSSADVKIYKSKILIGGNIDKVSHIKFTKSGEHFNVISFGKGAFDTDIDYHPVISSKHIIKDKDGKIKVENISEGNKVKELVIQTSEKAKIQNNYEKEFEKLKNTELFKLLDKAFDGSILANKHILAIPSQDKEAKNLAGEYTKFIDFVRNGEPVKALEYFRYTMLKRLPGRNYTPLAYYIAHSHGQKTLDNIRKGLDKIIKENDPIKAKIFVDQITNNFFVDAYIKSKENYPEIAKQVEETLGKYGITIHKDPIRGVYYSLPGSITKKLKLKRNTIKKGQELLLETIFKKLGDNKAASLMHKWYTASMPMYNFETENLFGKETYNRSLGFSRTVRNELLFNKGDINLGTALEKSDWFKNLDPKEKELVREHLVIHSKKNYERILKEASQIEKNKTPEWMRKLPEDIQEKIKAFYEIIYKNHKYIDNESFKESPTYEKILAKDIIAFPFTYKLASKESHGHVPIYGEISVVDKNGNGKIDKNDYEIIKNKNVKEYVFDMLTPNFKKSLNQAIEKIYNEKLTEEELKQLFTNNRITKNGKEIKLDYDLGLFKWGECFNTALGIMNLSIGGNKAGIDAVNATVYLVNDPATAITNNLFGYGNTAWPGSKVGKPESISSPSSSGSGGASYGGGAKDGGGGTNAGGGDF